MASAQAKRHDRLTKHQINRVLDREGSRAANASKRPAAAELDDVNGRGAIFQVSLPRCKELAPKQKNGPSSPSSKRSRPFSGSS